MIGAYPVTFTPEPSGRVQLARTGSGFWREDHGEPFGIDADTLALLLRNTRLRARPLRMDFMHYANGSEGVQPISALAKAGVIDPDDITLEPCIEPSTGTPGLGLFAPNSWTAAGWEAVELGLNEISPLIRWNYKLPEDAIDPETGEVVPAGTVVGPCITGVSLVDRGFFWMDKVQLYSEGSDPRRPSLYQEQTIMPQLTTDQLIKTLQALQKAGLTDAQIMTMVGIDAAEQEALAKTTDAPTTPPDVAPMADAKPPVPAVLAAKEPAPVKAGGLTLAQLVARAKATTAPTAPKLDAANYGEKLLSLEARLAAIEDQNNDLMIADLERQGLTVGMHDPKRLYKENPSYFLEAVAKKTPLTQASPAAPNRVSGLKVVKQQAGSADEDKFALGVKAYREEQKKAGRPIDQFTAIEEYEALQAAR